MALSDAAYWTMRRKTLTAQIRAQHGVGQKRAAQIADAALAEHHPRYRAWRARSTKQRRPQRQQTPSQPPRKPAPPAPPPVAALPEPADPRALLRAAYQQPPLTPGHD